MHDDSFGKKIIEGGLWLSASAFFARLIGFAVTFSLVAFLSLEEYGTYKLVVAAFGFFAAFFVSGFDALVINDLVLEKKAGKFDRVKKLFCEYSGLKIVVGGVLFLFTLFGSFFLGRFYGGEILSFFPLISFLFLFVALERIFHLLLNLSVKFRLMSLFTIVEEAVKLLLVLFFIGFLKRGAAGAILADVLSTGVSLLLFLPYGIRLLRGVLVAPARSRGSVLWEIVRVHGKWALAAQYVGDIKGSIRPWIIKVLVGTEAVALWAFAESLYGQIISLFPFTKVLAPLLPHEIGDHQKIRMLLVRGMKYGTPLFAAVGVGAAIGVPPLIRFFFPQYTASIPLFLIVLFTILTSATAFLLTSILYAHREQRTQFLLNGSMVLLMVGAGFPLVRFFGLPGMAIEFLLTAFLYNISRVWYIFRFYPELRFRFSEILRWTADDRNVFLNLMRYAFSFVRSRP